MEPDRLTSAAEWQSEMIAWSAMGVVLMPAGCSHEQNPEYGRRTVGAAVVMESGSSA